MRLTPDWYKTVIDFNLFEAADSKQNLHMTHIDEDLYERGFVGAEFAIESLEDVLNTLQSNATSAKNITVKYDGAPALWAGIDPADGKFFVGTKSVFNKTPKLYKDAKDIDGNEPSGKAVKLKMALKHLSSIGIPKGTVLQGDMMFTKGDQKYETIDGRRYITIHPNTLVYAYDHASDVGKQIRNADMGIVFHTTYKGGKDLQTYSASFGADVSRLKKSRSVWVEDAFFKNVAGTATLTNQESRELKDLISKAKRAISKDFDKIVEVMKLIPSAAIGAHIKSYCNSEVRAGTFNVTYSGYVQYVKDYWEKRVISKVKTEASKDTKRAALKQLDEELKSIKKAIDDSFKFINAVNKAKVLVMTHLTALLDSKVFVLKTNGDFIATAPEGYVAIGKEGQAVKLIDRLSFSHYNFSDGYKKGWMK
jgi:hypothetical protein